jgi:hypothetical protein
MNHRLSLSIFTIEVDGKPTLAFEAKRYSEAEAICGDEGLRAKLSLLKSGGVPLCGDNALLDVRLAHPDKGPFIGKQLARHNRPMISCWSISLSWMGRRTSTHSGNNCQALAQGVSDLPGPLKAIPRLITCQRP